MPDLPPEEPVDEIVLDFGGTSGFIPAFTPHARDAPVLSITDFEDGQPVGRTYQIACRCGAILKGKGFASVRLLWRWGEVHVCGRPVLGVA